MSEAFTGEIRVFGGNYAPEGWMLCNGQILAITDYTALYSLIGVTYGGDGRSTFAVPDLRAHLAVGQSAAVPPGMSFSYPLAATGGTTTVALTEATMPSHTHQATASSQPATAAGPPGNLFAATTAPAAGYVTNPTTTYEADPVAITTAGSSQPHPNLMLSLGLSYIICLNGLYPTFPN
ncbi:MAG: tail fiber protein [Rhizomicrobium sp.]